MSTPRWKQTRVRMSIVVPDLSLNRDALPTVRSVSVWTCFATAQPNDAFTESRRREDSPLITRVIR